MKGRMQPYVPELTIRDYNTYLWYLRGIRHQLAVSYGLYSCCCLRANGVLFALLADSLAGRPATCKRIRRKGTLRWEWMMTQTQGIRLAAQIVIFLAWHHLNDFRWEELPPKSRVRKVLNSIFLRRAYRKAIGENPDLERIFVQVRDHAEVQRSLRAKNFDLAADPESNLYGALYAMLATDEDPSLNKSMRFIGCCLGKAFYLMDKAKRLPRDQVQKRYNVFLQNGITDPKAATESARRQALAAAAELVRAYNLLDIKLNRSLLNNIMILGLRHAIDPTEADGLPTHWELP